MRRTSEPLWIGIDLGTQSVRAVALTEYGVAAAAAAHPLVSRRDGKRHTQDPHAWWAAVCTCCLSLAQQVDPARMQGVALDATSGTILLTDARGHPATDALMYDDSRAETEAALVREAGAALWRELDYGMQPSWALPKLLWLMRHQAGADAGVYGLVHQNDFIHRLLAGRRVPTDWSHALKSGYDLIRLRWPFEVLETLGLPASLFPEVVSPGQRIGELCDEAARQTGLPAGLPMFAGMTDGCAAQIASGATAVGSWNSVLGTTLVLKGVTCDRLCDPLGVVYSHRSADSLWLPGGASSSGAGVIARELSGADLARLSVESETQPPSTVVVFPLVSPGERFPFHAPTASGFRIGTPRDEGDLYRALLQGISFMERLSFDYLAMLGAPMDGELTISGGSVRSEYWNRLRATILGRPLLVADAPESAHGMAVLAAASRATLPDAVARMVRRGRQIDPAQGGEAKYGEGYNRLLDSLVLRGWLAEPVARFAANTRLNGSGGESSPATLPGSSSPIHAPYKEVVS